MKGGRQEFAASGALRNKPCLCGSGTKAKKCCLAADGHVLRLEAVFTGFSLALSVAAREVWAEEGEGHLLLRPSGLHYRVPGLEDSVALAWAPGRERDGSSATVVLKGNGGPVPALPVKAVIR